ncbi:MAG: hypothetical protein ABI877_11035 [Gemmatimonadaceae bacterium]
MGAPQAPKHCRVARQRLPDNFGVRRDIEGMAIGERGLRIDNFCERLCDHVCCPSDATRLSSVTSQSPALDGTLLYSDGSSSWNWLIRTTPLIVQRIGDGHLGYHTTDLQAVT